MCLGDRFPFPNVGWLKGSAAQVVSSCFVLSAHGPETSGPYSRRSFKVELKRESCQCGHVLVTICYNMLNLCHIILLPCPTFRIALTIREASCREYFAQRALNLCGAAEHPKDQDSQVTKAKCADMERN